ncbi:hypothetical protein AB1F87_004095 [Vibrio mimicus]
MPQWKQANRGRTRHLNNLAITAALMVKRIYSLLLMALQSWNDSMLSIDLI